MAKFYVGYLLGFLLAIQSVAQSRTQVMATPTYRNPVIAGDFADPSIIRVGDTYYAAGTSSEWAPAFPMYSSKDLINWTYLGPVFSKLPAWTKGSYWAPELFYRNGTFFVYYTARRKSDGHSYIGVGTTRDLSKGFTDHGLLLEWTSEAIDAFVIEDAGKCYITWKAYGLDKGKTIAILGAELADDGLKVKGDAFPLLTADATGWEAGGAEGQAIIKHGRYYYMAYSGNACCGPRCNYQVGFARSEKLQGPWEKFSGNPVLVGDEAWKCPGHGTLVRTPDNRYFYLHHAYNGTDFTFTGRQGVLSELVWDEKTLWPAFRYGNTVPAQAEAPTKAVQKKMPSLSVDFSKGTGSDIPWVWDVSVPEPTYTTQNGFLSVTNSTTNPVGSFLGLVVNTGTYTFTADIVPQVNQQQSICLYGDANNALGLGVSADSVNLWQIKEGKHTVLASQFIGKNRPVVTLQLHSRFGQLYDFSFTTLAGKAQQVTVTPVNGSYLPRWDRAPRLGISITGQNNARTQIRSIAMQYN